LKMMILNHIMTHALVVPEDEVAPLLSQLRHYQLSDNPEFVCPRLANKLVKAMIFPLFGAAARRVLTNLQELLRSTTDKGTLWDQAFSLVFLCLIVIGKSQASLVERAQLGLANGDSSYTLEDARTGVEEMEQELSIHLIGMFHLRFGTDGEDGENGKGFNPFIMYSRDRHQCSWLMQSVVQATQTYGECLPPKVFQNTAVANIVVGSLETISLSQLELDRMKEKNVLRLLSNFMQPFGVSVGSMAGAP
jgi:hypothetical protein